MSREVVKPPQAVAVQRSDHEGKKAATSEMECSPKLSDVGSLKEGTETGYAGKPSLRSNASGTLGAVF